MARNIAINYSLIGRHPEPKDVRCVWLARTIPLPLNTGDKVYTARLAQAFVAAGASVTFMGLADSAAPSLRDAEIR